MFEKERIRQSNNRRRQSGVKESIFLDQEYWKILEEWSKLTRVLWLLAGWLISQLLYKYMEEPFLDSVIDFMYI